MEGEDHRNAVMAGTVPLMCLTYPEHCLCDSVKRGGYVDITQNARKTAIGVISTYSKHTSILSVQVLNNGGPPIYKLEHADSLNAPNAIFYSKDGQTSLMFDFHNLCVIEECWPM